MPKNENLEYEKYLLELAKRHPPRDMLRERTLAIAIAHGAFVASYLQWRANHLPGAPFPQMPLYC